MAWKNGLWNQIGLEIPLWSLSNKITWGKSLNLFVLICKTGIVLLTQGSWETTLDVLHSFQQYGVTTCQVLWIHSFLLGMFPVMTSALMVLTPIASLRLQAYSSNPELSPDSQTHSLNCPLEFHMDFLDISNPKSTHFLWEI